MSQIWFTMVLFVAFRRCSSFQARGSIPLGLRTSSVSKTLPFCAMSSKSNLEKIDLNPARGTRDFYPSEMKVRSWLFRQWREVSHCYGFDEYDCPVLESEALFIRKAGEEVTQQLYNFEDKGNRKVALRPEMTPSLARMVMARKSSLAFPIKWFSIPQCFRYERMSLGRKREHYQWNMDIWGVQGCEAETELLCAIVSFFKKVGFTSKDIAIKVNSRSLLACLLTNIGVSKENFSAICILVDKLEKVPLDSLRNDFHSLGIHDDLLNKMVKVLKIGDLASLKTKLQFNHDDPSRQQEENRQLESEFKQLESLFAYAKLAGIEDWLVLDTSMVRGLSYYTGIVFEAFDRKGKFRSICGGGRYDNLLTTMGSDSAVPACGFGFGDVVVMELLACYNKLPQFENNIKQCDIVVAALSLNDEKNNNVINMHGEAIQVAELLRQQGLRVELVLEHKKMKWILKHALKKNSPFLALIGPDEWNSPSGKSIVIKNLLAEVQTTVPVKDLGVWADSYTKAP